MFTTLNRISTKSLCDDSWKKLLANLNKTQADDEPLNIATILDSNGLTDALLCLRTVEGKEKELRLYAVWCARQVQHLMADQRSLDALDVAERFANGEATQEELTNARISADAVDATGFAAFAATWCSAAPATNAAGAAAWYAAASDASGDMQNSQGARLREICSH